MMQNHKDYTAGRYTHVELVTTASMICFIPIAIYLLTLNTPNYKFSVLILLASKYIMVRKSTLGLVPYNGSQ